MDSKCKIHFLAYQQRYGETFNRNTTKRIKKVVLLEKNNLLSCLMKSNLNLLRYRFQRFRRHVCRHDNSLCVNQEISQPFLQVVIVKKC